MIQLQNLSKYYGDFCAVNNINFEVKEGEILGFLGPNGAGKSTTLKMITCFLSPTSGSVNIDDLSVEEDSIAIRKKIGYLPELNPLYHEMIVYDYLEFIAEIRDIEKQKMNSAIRKVVEKCGLTDVVHKPIHTLSKGYKQRVGLAQAIIHEPQILILDEPTSGLDPNQIIEIRDLIKELGKEKTLIISSHILQEVQAVCDRIIIINKGEIVADGTTEELKASMQSKARLSLELKGVDVRDALIQENKSWTIADYIAPKKETYTLILEYPASDDQREAIYQWLKTKDVSILEMHRNLYSLEDVFRSLTTSEVKNV